MYIRPISECIFDLIFELRFEIEISGSNHLPLKEAAHQAQLLGRLATEVPEGVEVGELRPFENSIERAVGRTMNINAHSAKDNRVALLRCRFHPEVGLHSCVVVFVVACQHTINVLAHGHAPTLARNDLQVHAQLRVGKEVAEEALADVCLGGVGCLVICLSFAEYDSKRFVTLEVLAEYLANDLGFVLLRRTRWPSDF